MSAPPWYVRDPAVVAIARGDEYLFFSHGRPPVVLEGVDVEDLSSVLAASALPVTGEALGEICSEDALALLVEHGILLRGLEDDLRARLPRRAGPPATR